MAEGRDLRRLTEDEYLAFDRESERRWEYVDGEAFECMAGRTEHNAVVANVSRALGNALGARPCIVLGSQQKVATRATRGFHYPDVSVVCGPFERHPKEPNAIANPSLILEVLSPTTADYDRGAKFDHYRTLPSLIEILYVAIESRTIERRRRTPSGEWMQRWVVSGEIELESVGVSIAVEDVLAKVELAMA